MLYEFELRSLIFKNFYAILTIFLSVSLIHKFCLSHSFAFFSIRRSMCKKKINELKYFDQSREREREIYGVEKTFETGSTRMQIYELNFINFEINRDMEYIQDVI